MFDFELSFDHSTFRSLLLFAYLLCLEIILNHSLKSWALGAGEMLVRLAAEPFFGSSSVFKYNTRLSS